MTRAVLAWALLSVAVVLPRHSAVGQEMPGMRHTEMRWAPTFFLLAEKLEIAPGGDGRPVFVDAIGWYGGARNRLWTRVEGELNTQESDGDLQLELLYGRLITPFFDALFGVRVDQSWADERATRALLAAGVEGLAPNWFELEASVFLSEDGDFSGRITAAYDLLFTQRLVLEPRLELNASSQRVPEFGIGSGLSNLELGARLRYEIRRKFAPYAGLNWDRRFGATADFARQDGEPIGDLRLVGGLRVWY